MDWWQAAILGLVQGLAEFLPISSSAHLILIPKFFNFPDPGLSFDAVLHLGTLAALLAVFWRDWVQILQAGFGKLQTSNFKLQNNSSYNLEPKTYNLLLWWILVASIPGAVAGFLLEGKAETIFREPQIIALTLAGFGIILWIAQRFAKEKKITFWKSLWIGIAQVFAIIPGVSRSGATISAGMFVGLSKVEAAKFSFLLATPIVLGAGVFSLKNVLVQPEGAVLVEPVNLAVGLAVSAVSGFLAIKFLLKWVSKASYTPFVVYRLLLAGAIFLALALK